MVEPPLSDYEVIRFLVERGGRCTNYELVSNFRNILNDPLHQAEARLKFKDIINSVATVVEYQNIKYIELKKEYIFTKPQIEVHPTSCHSSLPSETNSSSTYNSPLTNAFQPYWRYRLSTSPQLLPSKKIETPTPKSFNRSVSETTLHQERPTRAIRSPTELKSQNLSSNYNLQQPSYSKEHYNQVRRISSYHSNEIHPDKCHFSNYFYCEKNSSMDPQTPFPNSSFSQTLLEPKSSKNWPKTSSSYRIDDPRTALGKESFGKCSNPQETRSNGRDDSKKLDPCDSQHSSELTKNNSEKPIHKKSSESFHKNSSLSEKQNRSAIVSLEENQCASDEKKKVLHETNQYGGSESVQTASSRKCFDDSSERKYHEGISEATRDGNKVKDRVQHFDEMEKKQRLTPSGGKENKISFRNSEDDVSITVLDSKLKKEWFVKSSQCDYHSLISLLKKEPKLAALKDVASGYTALHWAAKHGDANVVKLIAGAYRVSPNIRSNGGYTPVHLASLYKHSMIGHLLIHTYGADPSLRDYNGKRADQYPSNYIRMVAGQRNVERRGLKQRPLVAKEPSGNSFMRIGSLNLRKARKSTVFASNRNWGSASELGFGSIRKKREKKSVAEDSDSDSAYGFSTKS